MSKKLPASDFEWVGYIFTFDEGFMKSYNDESDERYFLEVDIQYPENLHSLHNDSPFMPEEWKLKNLKNMYTYKIEKEN